MNKIETGKINPEIKPVQVLESRALEETINNILSPLPEETAEEYLCRVEGDLQREWGRFAVSVLLPVSGSEEFRQKFSEVYNDASILIFREKKLKEKFSEVISNLLKNQERQSEKKDQEVLSRLNSFIHEAVRDAPEDHTNELEKQCFFRGTNQERNFFRETEKGHKDSYSYAFMMFGLSDSFMKRDEMENYIHSLIDNKTIFLFGGGDSIKDLLYSKEYKPKKIINFDPYLKQESVGKRKNIDYESRMISASDKRIKDLATTGELPKADEIWVTYSVPYYLNVSEDITLFFQNIVSLLNEGGSARIFPIVVQGRKLKGETYETRKNTLVQSVRQLMASDQFNVSLYFPCPFIEGTLKIHKLKK